MILQRQSWSSVRTGDGRNSFPEVSSCGFLRLSSFLLLLLIPILAASRFWLVSRKNSMQRV
jgi:hypothetical protein